MISTTQYFSGIGKTLVEFDNGRLFLLEEIGGENLNHVRRLRLGLHEPVRKPENKIISFPSPARGKEMQANPSPAYMISAEFACQID